MTRKIIFSLFILITGYFFYKPMVISLSTIKNPEAINFKFAQTFKLKDIPGLESSQNMVVYIVLDHEDRKNTSATISKWKVLKSSNLSLVNDLINCEFKYTGSDVSTVQSMIYVYSNNSLVFESEISLDTNNLGLQNRATGWATPVDQKQFLHIINRFDRYNLPVLIINN
ncbi:hypothetical protein DBR39_03485 [Chryseobacterium sp. KBW03]|uniref:hypothetical protein n=1 Tax=Chryseobacterium sp. KBW03 TaxID=2153362 RepID=UPI000F5AE5AA|nr:hypothetical protein [Chryseobacterium sp. KBW03]RQO41688.1 hypothetical protein DBR39_03485 [Chryseobacterium sp. KBW03]